MRQLHTFSRSFVVLGALVLGACSSDGSGAADAAVGDDTCVGRGCDGPDAGTDSDTPDGTVGAGCSSDGDCTAGLCDPTTSRCVAPCLADSDCGPTQRCDDGGLCVSRASCAAGDSCGAGEACNTCLGVCESTPGTTSCTADSNCGFDEFCESCLGRCLPRRELCDPCAEDRECGESGDLCLDYAGGGRFCGRRCGSCPVGYTCSEELGQCVALSGDCEQVRQCETSAECPTGQVCSPAFL